ncbi:ATP synthase subunit I [Halomonas sp. SH5A2]|uniref:ATP synthase subunit I n=1 Tax=Halomonas sp. SH5A2 TaxID=2749040 RepID=UPI001641F807|nr:ATP synthase subunit I [Halomonas sp. SH5A2]QNI04621.1 ATP synthase subunit I [Halomonas sp. SH5A2]
MQRLETLRRQAYVIRLAIAQLLVALVGTLLALVVADSGSATSVTLGALVAFLPQVFFVQRMAVFKQRVPASQSALRLFRAEAGKFGLTVALFAVVFITVPPSNPAFFFSAYIAVVLMHWLAPWLMPRKLRN